MTDHSWEFRKEDSSVPWDGLNEMEGLDYGPFGDTFHRVLHIADWDETSTTANSNARSTAIHEIGHNWNQNEGNPFWNDFVAQNRQSKADNDYARSYGKTNKYEDWATCWEAYFGYHTTEYPATPSSVLNQKLAIVDQFFAHV